MRIDQFLDVPGSPKVNVVPDVSFAFYHNVLAGAATEEIYHGINDAGVGAVPANPIWIIGTRPIFSWLIRGVAVAHPGFSLRIGVSYNGVAIFDWQTFAMLPGGVPNVMEGLHIPGWGCRFQIVNSSAVNVVDVTALIKQQGFE